MENQSQAKQNLALTILIAISVSHFINDMIQSLIFAIYPILKNSLVLNFTQIGLISLVYQCTASLLQPIVGSYTDKNHRPYSLVFGMVLTMFGLLLLGYATSFGVVLIAAAIIGSGSSIFHPESSRIARIASGGKHGFAQSFFQVGGNAGTAIGPLLAAFIILPNGQKSVAWFALAAVVGIVILFRVCKWYQNITLGKPKKHLESQHSNLSKRQISITMGILVALIFSKFFYIESIKSYYTFYLIHTFNLSIKSAQIHLFMFLAAAAAGVLFGGVMGDRFGRKMVIWVSILGSLPFTLMLPYCNLFWTEILVIIIALIMSSAFSAILVYAQELAPNKIGMISGLFFGIGFGMAGIGAATLGKLADLTSIAEVYKICSYLPVIGLLTYFLPDHKKKNDAIKLLPVLGDE
ncbi:MAG: MFS transporter [Pseudomonadota bacterium]